MVIAYLGLLIWNEYLLPSEITTPLFLFEIFSAVALAIYIYGMPKSAITYAAISIVLTLLALFIFRFLPLTFQNVCILIAGACFIVYLLEFSKHYRKIKAKIKVENNAQAKAQLNSAYTVLGFTPGQKITKDDAKRVYHTLAAIHHPNKPTGNKDKMAQIIAAHNVVQASLQKKAGPAKLV